MSLQKELQLKVQFEWDTRKAKQNIDKHGVPFEYGVRVFLDPRCLDIKDSRQDYGEERRLALGEIEGRLYLLAYTPRNATIRVISARKANGREQRHYDQNLSA